MKVTKPTRTTLVDAVIACIAIGGGIAASGAMGAAATSVLPDQPLVGKGVIAVAGIGAASAIKGKDNASNAARLFAAGVAGKQAYDVIAEAIKPKVTVKEAEQQTLADKMLYGAVGLACPENTGTRYLASPIMDFSRQLGQDRVVENTDNTSLVA